jgi:hypothetical protein
MSEQPEPDILQVNVEPNTFTLTGERVGPHNRASTTVNQRRGKITAAGTVFYLTVSIGYLPRQAL